MKVFEPEALERCDLPLFSNKVQAGTPSPTEDFLEGRLDLNEHLIKNPPATFFVRVTGDSMINAGIFPDDILIVDRALEAKSGKVIIAVLNGELTVKRLKIDSAHPSRIFLMPENSRYGPISVTEEMDFHVWGVVTNVIHKL